MQIALMSTFDEHSVMFRTTTNGDFLRTFVAFLSHEPKKTATNINVTKRNTSTVLYNINSGTVISLQHQHYICYIHNYIIYSGTRYGQVKCMKAGY